MKSQFINMVSLIVCISTGSLSFAGNESGGGGFAFTNAKRLLEKAKQNAIMTASHRDEACVNREMAKIGGGPVNLEKIRKIISETRKNYTAGRERVNAEGVKEPLVMDYGKDESGEYIEALKLFFVGFMGYQEQDQPFVGGSSLELSTKLLLHEAVHHFGYDDKHAEQFAVFIAGPFEEGKEWCMGN